MSEKVLVICRSCRAKLKLRKAPEDLVGRKIRCPECETAFTIRPEMVRSVEGESKSATAPLPLPSKKSARQASRFRDDDDDSDDVPALPVRRRPSASKSKRTTERDDDDSGRRRSTKEKTKQPKKKPRRTAERSVATAFMMWTLCGLLGGLLGGGIWWGTAYLTGLQLGFLSILIGTCIGIGVRLGAREYEGWIPGTTGVILTLMIVFLSKLTLNYTLFAKDYLGQETAVAEHRIQQEQLVTTFAELKVAPEYRKQGKPVFNLKFQGVDWDDWDEDLSDQNMYDPAFKADVDARWQALTPQEKTDFEQLVKDRERGIDRDSLILHLADQEVLPEFERTGKPVHLTPEEMRVSDGLTMYKPEVMEEATRRFDAKTPEERQSLIQSIDQQHADATKTVRNFMLFFVLVYTILSFLWPSTLICLILACASAYQIGQYDGITT